jgi:integrase
MGIKLTADGTYESFFSKRHPLTRMPHSRRRTKIKTQAEARRIEKKLVLEVEDILRRKIIPSWVSFTEKYIQSMHDNGLSRNTIETYETCLKAHTFEAWGQRLIDTITGQEVRELVLTRLAHRSPSHQKNMLKYIRGVFTFAVESGILTRNPTPIMKFRIGDKIKSVLTESEVRTLLNKAREVNCEWYYHWVVAIYTGMRNGELFALRWDKVNFDNRQILVDCAWNNKDGFKDTKSGNDRKIEIAPNLLVILKELKLKSDDSIFVLPRIDKWNAGEQARELRLFLECLGLPRIRFHDLRATWATIMLTKGVEPVKVMKMAGWADIKTMQIYIRKAGVDIKGITNKLDLHEHEYQSAQIFSLPNSH